ncbi:hypothetical protein K431DRAFT_341343 [Polychaeton citri CBS 116435]|uniref:Photolyase/cryptochrome alpha/beta domain-containing protein n=1 Tax=Polychaeton citri CBS 116435 TaxID=1314669 RepID=A0A9P4UJ19_9PEZI|nr:hypothetical protein K431DRAFT_341343 [Polychaeton citri CBS 116435]
MAPKFKKYTPTRVLYWHRTDLRLHDSPALHAALNEIDDIEAFWPIWCWDPHYVYHARVGPNRFQFLIDCQNDLSSSYQRLNPKQKLWVLREGATTLLPKLMKAWKITHLVFEKDTDAYAKERDTKVVRDAEEAGVTVMIRNGRTLWDSDEVAKKNGGKPTMSATQLQAAGAKVGDISRPVPTPEKLPDPGDADLSAVEQERPERHPDFNEQFRDSEEKSYASGLAGPKGDYAVPTLQELGFKKQATSPHKGGESVVLENLEKMFEDEDYIATFEKPRTSPAAFEPQSTLLTSPHLHFGSLSCRYLYWRTEDLIDKRRKEKKPTSGPPTSITGQLLFRDMYFAAQAALGYSFAQTYDNPHCRFVPWHLPSKVNVDNKLISGEYEVDDPQAEEYFHRWRDGKTGFPWIDAIMRQLRSEGWIHHLARHSVACFLTRGGCYVSWERGAEVFEELLIDHETACNAGNWQWLSCTAFFAQFYRCYSPIAFGKKWDPEGNFVRRYVPELAKLDKKYIYEPYKAPIADQKRAGLLVSGGKTEGEEDGRHIYPKPMFDFNEQREICIQGLKTAYHVGLYGNSPAVIDGTWKKHFDDAAEGPTEGTEGGPGGSTGWQDAEGHEEYDPDGNKTPKLSREGSSKARPKSPRTTRAGHKREASQSTLDVLVQKKSSKKS